MKEKFINLHKEFRLILSEVPTLALTLFIISVFAMNLLANKSIKLPFEWLSLDCGIIVSWFVFLTMNVIATHFGPRASTILSVFSTFINLILCCIFFIASIIPGDWGESFVEGSNLVINQALDNTFGGTWYVLLGSSIAFLVSAVVTNYTNHLIAKCFKNNKSKKSFLITANAATCLGQFTDNLIFALLVSHTFFGWTLIQCITCAITGMLVELLCEGIFSIYGYKICLKWQNNNIGKEYLQQYGDAVN